MSERLAKLIREHQPCAALTGAGVSTEDPEVPGAALHRYLRGHTLGQ
jgi:hypothetical protein